MIAKLNIYFVSLVTFRPIYGLKQFRNDLFWIFMLVGLRPEAYVINIIFNIFSNYGHMAVAKGQMTVDYKRQFYNTGPLKSLPI